MKFGVLKSIGHNIADSVGSGLGFMIGVYDMDIYGEAAAIPEGCIEVDFLAGKVLQGDHSQSLAQAILLYAKELPQFCERNGASISEFRKLVVRFSCGRIASGFAVTVEDQNGRSSTDEYRGSPAERVKILDGLGRVRRS